MDAGAHYQFTLAEPLGHHSGAVLAYLADSYRLDAHTLWEKTRLTTLYVTHNIQEAVMLADRVVLLSRRPGKVNKILTIDIPRADRDKAEHAEEIAEFIRIIWEHISKDARAALMEVENDG